MTDVTVAEPAKANIIRVPITKGGGYVEINADTVPIEVYQAALELGFKEMANRGMSKITVKGLEGTDLAKAREAAMKKGEENAEAIRTGKVRITGAKAASTSKVSKALQAEARRIARDVVKDELRKAGKKISHYKAAQITKAADELIAADPSFLEQAQRNLSGRADAPAKIDIASLIKEDPDLVAKAEAKKKDAPLSAKQAGLVAKSKPKVQPVQMH